MTDYEKICDFQSLYKAHLASRRCKRYKREVINFELNLAKNLTEIQSKLEKRTYKMNGYYNFKIYEPKERQVYAAFYADRVVQHCICDEVLCSILQPRLIYDNAACQIGKGTHFAMKRLTKFLSEYYKQHGAKGYVLKCDISKYFASIDHEVLKNKLEKVVADPDVKNLLFHFIDSYETPGQSGKGLPLGNQSSQWFSIYYLDSLDRLIKERLRVKYYVRYMDDCILIHENKDFLQTCLQEMQMLLENELKLQTNKKTQLFPIKNGVEFLGYRFFLTDTGKVIKKMRTASKKRFKRRLKKVENDYAQGAISLDDAQNTIASYKGHLKHGHTYRLRENVYKDFILVRKT